MSLQKPLVFGQYCNADHWSVKLGINIGMSRQEAFDRFIKWRISQRTCQRCEGEKYIECCPVHLICKEADDARNAVRNDHGTGITETPEHQTLRTRVSKARERTAIRQTYRQAESLSRRRSNGLVQEMSDSLGPLDVTHSDFAATESPEAP